uniref:Bm3624 n=1 Tax=Brugia malayi TaxID=6279 RepID=A0A0H5SAG6_BRUMA|nr:Bm3624 [Brugia malayi]
MEFRSSNASIYILISSSIITKSPEGYVRSSNKLKKYSSKLRKKFAFDQNEAIQVAELANSTESPIDKLCGPSEVAARVERLLFDVINKAETALKELSEHGTEMVVSESDGMNRMNNSGRQPASCVASPGKLKGQQRSVIGNSEISPSLVLNERPGVRYLCCDRFFKCDGRNLIAREIWPSDGGCIELNRKELKRFIINNEARRLNGSKVSRQIAGGSLPRCASDISRNDNTLTTGRSIQSFTSMYRQDHNEICQQKRERSFAELNSTSSAIHSNEDLKTRRQLCVQGNFAQVIEDTSSETSITSITESPETLISSEITGLTIPNVDELSSDETEPPTDAHNFVQNRGDQLIPAMKPDGTIVIPGVVHVENFEGLNGVVLELKVLIKSPKESRRFTLKIDCPDFKPKTVKVNGIKTQIL